MYTTKEYDRVYNEIYDSTSTSVYSSVYHPIFKSKKSWGVLTGRMPDFTVWEAFSNLRSMCTLVKTAEYL